LRDTFLAEAEELLEQIGDNLLRLEKQPQDSEVIDSLFRAFHTLKGSAGLVGCEAVKVLSHGLEDVLDDIRSGRRQVDTVLINRLLSATDVLKEAVAGAATGEAPAAEEIDGLLCTLREGAAGEDRTTPREPAWHGTDGECRDLPLMPLPVRLDLLQAVLQGRQVVFIRVKCCQEIFYRGLDPLRLFQSTVEAGGARFLHLAISGEDLPGPDDFDPERCYVAIEACLQLPVEPGGLLEQLEFIRDDADIQVFPVSVPMLFAAGLVTGRTVTEAGQLERVKQLVAGTPWPEDRESLTAKLDELVHVGLVVAGASPCSGGVACYFEEAILLGRLLRQCLERGTPGAGSDLNRVVEDVKNLICEYLDCHGADCYPSLPPRTAAEDLLRLFFPGDSLQPKPGVVLPTGEMKAGPLSEAAGKTSSPALLRSEMLRVDSKKIDKLMELAGELVIIKNSLAYWMRLAQNAIKDQEQAQALKEQQLALAKVTREIQEAVAGVRMVPIGQVFHKFTRFVRDASVCLNKEVDLVFQGEDTELDRNVVESLYEPLLHLVRNSLDHGMEPPEERGQAGKPLRGTLWLRAYHEGTRVSVEVEDDGRGIDVERVKAKAVAQGLLSVEEAIQLSRQDALALIFRPGLSTADNITEISGRGVGMDAVISVAHGLGGSVSVDSVPGSGTRIKISVPLTVATSRVLIVRAAAVETGITMDDVEKIVYLTREQLTGMGKVKLGNTQNSTVPVLSLAEVLGLPGVEAGEEYRVVLLRNGIGVQVEAILGDEDMVIRKLPGEIGELPLYKGAALRGNGKVLMVLDSKYFKGWLGHGLYRQS